MRHAPMVVCWDMDGTLVDTEPLWGQATYELSEKLGRRIGPEQRARTVGGSFGNTLAVCADHAGVELAQLDVAATKRWFFSRVAELLGGDVVPRPGVEGVLAGLQEMGVPMFLTTNTVRPLTLQVLERIGPQYFSSVITGSDVSAPKPDPEMYMTAAKLAGRPPAEVLVFEDSVAGQTAALRAGCRVVGLPAEGKQDLVDGAVFLGDLRGDGGTDFAGVSARDVATWFERLA